MLKLRRWGIAALALGAVAATGGSLPRRQGAVLPDGRRIRLQDRDGAQDRRSDVRRRADAARRGRGAGEASPKLFRPPYGKRLIGLPLALDGAGSFTESMMPWVALPEGIPAFATVYDPFELLPPERVARRQATIERRKAGEG